MTGLPARGREYFCIQLQHLFGSLARLPKRGGAYVALWSGLFLAAQTGIELIETRWMKSSLLELNADKTRIMPVGPSSPLSLVGSELTNVAEKGEFLSSHQWSI